MTKTRYYSFEDLDTGEFQGLIRERAGVFEYASDGRWIEDEYLAGRIADPRRRGADAPDVIDGPLVIELARRHGVEV